MLKELVVKIGADTSEFIKKMNEVTATTSKISQSFFNMSTKVDNYLKNNGKSIESFGEKMNTFGKEAMAKLSLPLLAGAGASIKLASDMQESLNKVNVAFGDSSSSVIEWSKNSIESMGMASGTALDTASTFGDMATSIGIGKAEASSMSTSLVQLGADLASFKNIPIEQAMTALNGVFTGETESLKMLGVVMTQTQLEAFALSKGIKGNIKDFTEAEMVQLRYQFVLEKTKNAQGDFARTNDGSANQMRIFLESLKQLGVVIGDTILPYFNKFLKAINDQLKSFTGMSDTAKIVVIALGGLGIVLPPLIAGFGFLMANVNTAWTALKVLGSGMRVFLLNPVGLAITALAGFAIWLYKSQGSLENLGLYFKQWSMLWKIGWDETTKAFTNAFFNFQIFFKELELALVNSANSILNFFGITVDGIKNKANELQQELNNLNTEKLDYNIQKNAEIAKKWAYVYSTEVTKAINLAQEAMANKNDYFTKSIADMAGAQGRMAIESKQALDNVKTGLQDNKNKTDELSKKTEELRKKNIDLANTLSGAVVTALKNRNKAIDDSIAKTKSAIDKQRELQQNLTKSNEENYKQIVDLENNAYDESVQKVKDKYAQISEMDKDYIDSQRTGLEQQKSQFEQLLKEQSNAIAEQNFEQQKLFIINSNIYYRNAEERKKMIDKLSDLIISREKELNKDGNMLRLDSIEQLSSEENQLLKDRLNEQRQIELNSINDRIAKLDEFAKQQAEDKKKQMDAELTAELNAHNARLERRKAEYDIAQAYARDEYNTRINNLNSEIEAKKKGLIDLSSTEKENQASRKIILTDSLEEIKKLLNQYNKDWYKTGETYGQELINGLKSKQNDINNLVKSLQSTTQSTTKANPKLNTPYADLNNMANPTLSNSALGSLQNDTIAITPQIFLDSKEITRTIAPTLTDYIRVKTGAYA